MQGIKIKPLVWVKHPSKDIWRSDQPFGTYKVFGVGPTPSWDFDSLSDGKDKISKTADSVDAAKAAAQADYEGRILAALEAAPHVNETPKNDHDRADVLIAVAKALEDAAGHREQLDVWAQEIMEGLSFADVLKIESYEDKIEAHDIIGRGIVDVLRSLVPQHDCDTESIRADSVAPSLRITGPNSDGEYWLHIKAGGLAGGVNLGGERGPICKRLLDAASETGAKE